MKFYLFACEDNLALHLQQLATSEIPYFFNTTISTATMMIMKERKSAAAIAPAIVANVLLDEGRGDVGNTDVACNSGKSKEGRRLLNELCYSAD